MLTINAKISAITTANQIPFNPKSNGSIIITATWNTKVLKNDIVAETNPLFKAVKNDEAKILNPLTMKDNEKKRIAIVVISNNSIS